MSVIAERTWRSGPGRYEVSQGLAKDPGIVESRIPTADYKSFFEPIERSYSGFSGTLDSTEIVIPKDLIKIFNEYIVK
jgi:hypothetical protein